MIGILGDGTVMRPGYGILGDGAMMGPCYGAGDAVLDIVGRDVASIFCRGLMACNCSPPIDNGNNGSGLTRYSVKYSTYWCTASSEDSFGLGSHARIILLYKLPSMSAWPVHIRCSISSAPGLVS